LKKNVQNPYIQFIILNCRFQADQCR